MREQRFFTNLTHWLNICKILGFFPYQRKKLGLIKKKNYLIDYSRCLVLYIGNEVYFSRFKSKYNYFGWILVAVDFFFTLFWIIFFLQNNEKLIRILHLFDSFDQRLLEFKNSKIRQVKCHKNFIVNLVVILFIFDFFSMFYAVLYLRGDISNAIITGLSRALQRSVMTIFLTLFLYLLDSIKLRFIKLEEIWVFSVQNKIKNSYENIETSLDLVKIKTLYAQLINIIDSFNDCFGPRLVIMFTQLFYLILLYFYMICTGLGVVIFLLPFYLAVNFIVTLSVQSLYEKINISTQLLKLSSNTVSDRFLIQWYGFIQQLRVYPVQINAAGFFIIDQKLLGSLTMAIASYLVAIFQLAPLMDNIGKKTSISLV